MRDFNFETKSCPHCSSPNTELLSISLHVDCMKPYVGKLYDCGYCRCQFEEQFNLEFDEDIITKEPIPPHLRQEDCFEKKKK